MKNFGFAEILFVNEADNKIKVKDIYNNAVYDIPLNNHRHFQSQPMEHDIVMYTNIDDRNFKIVAIWETANDTNKRQGMFPLKSGELQMQGLYGQYIHLSNEGALKFVDSTMLNEFELGLNGFTAKLKSFSITTYDRLNVQFDKDVLITKTDENDEIIATVSITDKDIHISNKKASITITPDGMIQIDGDSIKFGSALLGDVVTNLTHPFCFVTGAPIQGSKKVKADS